MNLSQRLDQARQQRQEGEVADVGPTPFDLRLTRDERVYDGRDLRTGEELTGDRWRERRSTTPDDGGLPTWNPKRANEEVLGAWEADVTTPVITGLDVASAPLSVERTADVIDLRSRAAAPPAEPMIDTRTSDHRSGAGPTCPTCDGLGRLVRLDLLADHAHLECGQCGSRWMDRAVAYAPKGR